MNIVDSSAWLEYFSDTPQAKYFAEPIEDISDLIVPTITIYEVFKKVLSQYDKRKAVDRMVHMKQGMVVPLDIELALLAAKISHEQKLPMADSIIFATAQHYGATIWTQDRDFKGLAGVKYFEK